VISDKIRCPCSKCTNRKYRDLTEVEIHLYRFGFIGDYKRWICHGEPYGLSSSMQRDTAGEKDSGDRLREMVIDAVRAEAHGRLGGSSVVLDQLPNIEARKFYDMLQAADMQILGRVFKPLVTFSCNKVVKHHVREYNVREVF
jgi:oligoribonuclease (3'-5' exoribonuclease)